MMPMVAWQPAFSSTKYTFAVPFTSKRRNGRSPFFFLFLSPPLFFFFPSFFLLAALPFLRLRISRSSQPRFFLRIVRSIRLFALIRTGRCACYSFYPKFLLLLLSSATESNGFKILASIACIGLSDSDFTCSDSYTRDDLISFVAIGTSNKNRCRLDYTCINHMYVHVHLYICVHTRLLHT